VCTGRDVVSVGQRRQRGLALQALSRQAGERRALRLYFLFLPVCLSVYLSFLSVSLSVCLSLRLVCLSFLSLSYLSHTHLQGALADATLWADIEVFKASDRNKHMLADSRAKAIYRTHKQVGVCSHAEIKKERRGGGISILTSVCVCVCVLEGV
jgi:hypothetical protein